MVFTVPVIGVLPLYVVTEGSRVTGGHNSLDTISVLTLIVEAVDLVN